MGRVRSDVGTLWSTVETVRSGRRTLRPDIRRPSKAWGEVTSCTRCRSTYRMVACPGSSWTIWESHIFSNMVLGISASLRLRFVSK